MIRYLGFVFALIVFSLLGCAFWFLFKNMPEVANSISDSTYQLAIQQSRKDHKPIVLIFTASWCPPCQYMKKEVYPSPQVQAVYDRFHWITVDVDQPSNEQLKNAYGVHGIPHIRVVNETGKSLGKLVGGYDPDTFASFLKSTLE